MFFYGQLRTCVLRTRSQDQQHEAVGACKMEAHCPNHTVVFCLMPSHQKRRPVLVRSCCVCMIALRVHVLALPKSHRRACPIIPSH
eukprot:51133-Chlamydomonas_euryale.AAC.3